eukprot:184475-Chlamydomonas_euryale.AAC.1
MALLAHTHLARCRWSVHHCQAAMCMAAIKNLLHGAAWRCMALHGAAWRCMELHGAAWSCMALCGAAWHCMALHGAA